MKNKLLLLLLLFCGYFVVNSCKKDLTVPDPDVPVEKTLTLLTDNVEPGQMVFAQASEQINHSGAASISVNGTEAAAYIAGDIISFIMPVIPSGKVSVDYSNAGISTTLEVTIKNYTPVTNSEDVINKYITETDKAIAYLQEHTQNPITNLDPEYISISKYGIQTLKDNYKTLTEDEKLKLAYFLRGNMVVSSDFMLDTSNAGFHLGKKNSDKDPGEALYRKGIKMDAYVIKGVFFLAAGVGVIQSSPTPYDKILAVASMTTGVVFLQSAVSQAYSIASLTGVLEKIQDWYNKKEEKIEFVANVEENIYLSGEFRNLKLEDRSKTGGVIELIFKSIDKIQDCHDKLTNLANLVMSWYPWKTVKVPAYSNPIGKKIGTQELNLPGNKLRISYVSNPEIKLTATPGLDYLSIKATSETIKEETNFTFKVRYLDAMLGVNVEKEFQAVLKAKSYFLIDENNDWMIPPTIFVSEVPKSIYLSEDKQTRAKGIDYSKITIVEKDVPQSVKVELIKGSSNFSLKFTNSDASTQLAAVGVYYEGKFVQSVGAEVISSLGDYELEITTYRPDYSDPAIVAIKTLKPGDHLTVPNGMSEYCRLKYKGQYVKMAGGHALEGHAFPDNWKAEDVFVGIYNIKLSDKTNNKTINFPVKLTLDNSGYRAIVGKTYSFKKPNETTWKTIEFTNQSYTIKLSNGSVWETGQFYFPGSSAHTYQKCKDFIIDKRKFAAVQIGTGNNIKPGWMLFYYDGTISTNSGNMCPEAFNYFEFK